MAMMSDTVPIWIAVSLLYMLTSVYIHFAYSEIVNESVPLAFLTFGAAIFVAVNRRMWLVTDLQLLAAEGLVIAFVIIAWAFAIIAVHEFVTFHDRITSQTHDRH